MTDGAKVIRTTDSLHPCINQKDCKILKLKVLWQHFKKAESRPKHYFLSDKRSVNLLKLIVSSKFINYYIL